MNQRSQSIIVIDEKKIPKNSTVEAKKQTAQTDKKQTIQPDYYSHYVSVKNQIGLTSAFLEAVRAVLKEHAISEMFIDGIDGAQRGLCDAMEAAEALFENIEKGRDGALISKQWVGGRFQYYEEKLFEKAREIGTLQAMVEDLQKRIEIYERTGGKPKSRQETKVFKFIHGGKAAAHSSTTGI